MDQGQLSDRLEEIHTLLTNALLSVGLGVTTHLPVETVEKAEELIHDLRCDLAAEHF